MLHNCCIFPPDFRIILFFLLLCVLGCFKADFCCRLQLYLSFIEDPCVQQRRNSCLLAIWDSTSRLSESVAFPKLCCSTQRTQPGLRLLACSLDFHMEMQHSPPPPQLAGSSPCQLCSGRPAWKLHRLSVQLSFRWGTCAGENGSAPFCVPGQRPQVGQLSAAGRGQLAAQEATIQADLPHFCRALQEE